MTDTLPCDGCDKAVTFPDWCEHDRILCQECKRSSSCVHCARGAA